MSADKKEGAAMTTPAGLWGVADHRMAPIFYYIASYRRSKHYTIKNLARICR